ncbi:MAG: UDP-N-acetylmuramate dehydrogenase [Bacteroidales bacterium]|nr:UDP-N-acetylmuramate dehydrogenase [Bacteroidales bacterium]
MRIIENHSLKSLNTFGIDVSARYFAEVETLNELQQVYDLFPIETTPHLLLGGGSNLLFTDHYEGLVIKINLKGIEVVEENESEVVVKAAAGEDWDQFVSFCVLHGWGGLENLSLIPGHVGSSPIQNIGAYGVELKDCFESLEAFEKDNGQVRYFSAQACQFGYRDSIFKREAKGKYVILSVNFRLRKKNHLLNLGYGAIQAELQQRGVLQPTIADVREVVCSIRQSKLPDPAVTGNAGSFFKNPVVEQSVFERLKAEYPGLVAFPDKGGMKLAAGWLIEQAGWKGFREGDAGVHPLQALVLVNYGKASGGEIAALSEKIKASVSKTFGVSLETEVNIV